VNLVSVTLLLHHLVAVVVEDVHLMLVVQIDSSDPAFRVDGDGGDATSAFGDLYSLLLLAGASVPGEDGGLGAGLAGDSGVTSGVHTDAHHIIGVVVLVIGDVLGRVLDLTATEELLLVGGDVEDDTEGGSHVDSLVLAVPVHVLLRVSAAVAIDVFEVVLHGWLVVVDGVVIVRLNDLSNPWADRHELLTLSLLNLEEVILSAVVVLTTVAVLGDTGFLVIDLAATIGSEVGVIGKLAGCSSIRRSTAHF